MRSMTGYGRSTSAIESLSLTVQVSSVNRKTLDLTIGLPEEWESMEAAIGEQVRRYATRGKVHVDVEVTGPRRHRIHVGRVRGDRRARTTEGICGKDGRPFPPDS
jgi:uncharacterized protein (TIGR00255 family)